MGSDPVISMKAYNMFGDKIMFNFAGGNRFSIEGGIEEYKFIKSSFNNDMEPVELYHYLVKYRK